MKKLKHLKTFESLNSAEDAGLYDQMSDLLNRASEIYKEFSGEEYDFDPEDAIESLEELTPTDINYEEAQTLIDEIQDLEILFEEYNFDGFKELTYFGGFDEDENDVNNEIYINVLSDGTIINIYTYADYNFVFYNYETERKVGIKWNQGKNPLFVHCDKRYYKKLLKFIFSDFELVGLDENADENEYLLLHDLEVKMKKKYRS